MLLWLIRGAFVALLLGMAVFTANVFIDSSETGNAILVPLGILAPGG